MQSYNLIEAFRSTETCWSSANDEDVDITAIPLSTKFGLEMGHECRERWGMYMSAGAIFVTMSLCGVINSQRYSFVRSKGIV